MLKKIEIPYTTTRELKLGKTIKKVYENDASHFIKWNFRSDVFNIKSHLTKKKAKDQVLYIPLNVVSMMWGGFADFVVWDGVSIKIDDKAAQERRDEIAESCDFDDVLYNTIVEQSVYGFGNMRLRKTEDEEVVIEQIPREYYKPDLWGLFLGQQPKTYHIISVESDIKEVSAKKVAMITTYSKQENGTRLIERGYYTQTLQWERRLKEELWSETMDFLNLYRIDNRRIWSRFLWVSDFVDCMDLLEEINDRLTQISVQFIKHLSSKLSLPEGIQYLLKDKKKQVSDLDVFVHRQWEQPAQYIENQNHLMSDSLKYLDKLLRLMSALTQSHPSFFGLDDWGAAEKVEALRIRLGRFLKKVKRKQTKAKVVVSKIVKDALKLDGIETEISVDVKFTDDMLKDLDAIIERYTKLFETNMLSKRTALSEMFDRDDDMIDEELEKIANELAEKVAQNPALPDNTDNNDNQNGQWDGWGDQE